MDSRRRIGANSNGINSLWVNWAESVGSLTLVIFCGFFFSKLWLPALVIALHLLMVRRSHRVAADRQGTCNLLPFLVSRILFFSAVIMVGINLYYMEFINPQEYVVGTANRRIPYVTVLVVSSVSVAVLGIAYLRKYDFEFCYDCKVRYGLSSERGFLGKLYSQESGYQVRLLLIFSILVALYSWIYYALRYSNVNLNSSDKFFYNWLPVCLYGLSLIHMSLRYFGIYAFYRQNIEGETGSKESMTWLRYIIISGNNIFLSLDDKSGKYDTPASMHIPYRERVMAYDAEANFEKLIGRKMKSEVKFLYENYNFHADSNIFHYAIILDGMAMLNDTELKGEWFSLHSVEKMMRTGQVMPLLGSEIYRIYTVTMAYKTYDRNGMRLYDIRHYKPSFRLDEIKNLLVDYNDPVWLYVAKENEDRPFYHFRRAWRKYVRGL
ncbi:MAG: hypothetical protein NC127_07400 [Muribaculum sp.]|nr:hypothetical protein [Muribaculum sp.]